ncbi:hypothetical protein SPHINGOT1_80277 [Sphingomonas sp. T1]|uniref:hypothetical protein n=1 Tax=Sphingomonas sp. T1 TaxID=2653172 RepID=UPI0012F2EB70|nr:hypothetical protein [Sphingomonas sp. T1]VXD07966.1 hypothetical protein SPHINGOT1_80277 [Sphingomonas sp. T1]
MRASVLQASAAVGTARRGKHPNAPMPARQSSVPTPRGRSGLRTATGNIHERRHRHSVLSRRAASTADRDEYRLLLGHTYGFHTVVDPMLGVGGGLTGCLVWNLPEPQLSIGGWSRCAVGLDTNLPDAAVQDRPAATAAAVSMFAAYEEWMPA